MAMQLDEIVNKQQFIKSLKVAGVGVIKLSNAMPTKEEFTFHQKVPQIKEKQKTINKKLQDQILKIKEFVFGSKTPDFNLNKFSNISEINDQLLENIDICIDKIKKIRTDQENPFKLERDEQIKQVRSKNIQKPQENFFKDQIDNSLYPFTPKIRTKLHSQIPLDEQIISVQQLGQEEFFKDIKDGPDGYEFPHPYQFEIENIAYSDIQLSIKTEIKKPSKISKQNLFFIDNNEALLSMINALKNEEEIAVDLEHYEYRSFQGITCLIQISCRNNDYIIDPFPIWSEMQQLNILMTDPRIIKIFHGANMDVQWLQRDFGVYVVNMFDTFKGSKYLKLPQQSYAYLLKLYCNELSDKRMQTADWRIRPLPEDMIQYARIDTHYLINIYDQMKAQIEISAIANFNNQAILSIFKQSQEVCLIRYEKPILKNNSYQKILEMQQGKSKKYLSILEKMLEWRFEQARIYDESQRYIMSNQILFQIIDNIIDGRSTDQSAIGQILRQYSQQLHYLDDSSITLLTESLVQVLQTNFKEIHHQKREIKETDVSIVQQKVIIYKQQINNYQIDIESSFQLLSMETKLKVVQPCNSIFNIQDRKPDNLLNQIKQSFTYSEPTDLLVDMYPMLKQAYQQVLSNESEDLQNNINNVAMVIQEQPVFEEKQIERIEFIQLPEMNLSMRKEKPIKQLQLPDISKVLEPEQYKQLNQNNSINLKRKRPNSNQTDQIKKKNFNTFKILEENDSDIDDEISKQKQIQQMNQKADLLKSGIEKLQNFKITRDPIEKMQAKKFKDKDFKERQPEDGGQFFDDDKKARGNQFDISDQKFELQNVPKFKSKFKKKGSHKF